jgi:hypothetical protein
VEIGWSGKSIKPGKAGSRELAETAFGQNAALLSVSQLARVGGTVASGGIYKKCGPGMQLGAPCDERHIVNDPNLMVPILSGMEQVVLAGTARGLKGPAGVRIYGKTGTADAIGTKDEIVFGVPYNEWGPPNSWFLGVAEDEKAVPDQAHTPHRIVAVVVVPRGGLGARVAGPAAMEILTAAQSLGYMTPKAAPGQAGASGAPGTAPASPAPGEKGKGQAPLTILSPIPATPTPSAPPAAGATPPSVAPGTVAPGAVAPASPRPAAPGSPRPAVPASPRPSAPASPRPAAPGSPAAAATPRPPAASPAAVRSPAAATPRPSPVALASPSPPAPRP